MSTRLWLGVLFDPIYRCGGWAVVRQGAEGALGHAGGLRQTDPGALAAAALEAGLKGVEGPVALVLGKDLAGPVSSLAVWAKAGWTEADGAPVAEGWKALAARLSGRSASLMRAPDGANAAFVAAWAELGRDRAKAQGPFTAAIPKPNLAKLTGL